ncbi:MAG: T9SS type A sorting domain-containing protein, partial [Ignavibacteriales bacterium]|nr:T9SS type A sorting domain-containing protein [Ignavibacteriales bacterium]
NLYACGRMFFSGLSRHANVYTAKISGNTGMILWDRNYSYRQTGYDEALALAVDKNQNAYVTGSVETMSGITDLIVIKYDSATSGTNLTTARWIKTVDGGVGSDVGTCIGVASANKIYVGGYSAGYGSSLDFYTVLLSQSGNSADTVWTRRYTIPLYIQIDQIVGLVVDDSDNVIVTGISRTSDPDYRTIKYSRNGAVLWNKQYNVTFGTVEMSVGIAIDKANDVYVTGTIRTDIQKENIFTIKYRGSNGDTLWTSNINGPLPNSIDGASGVIVGSDSSVYVLGFLSNHEASGKKNYFITKLNSNRGTKIWSVNSDGICNNDDIPTSATVGSDGTVYITGMSKCDVSDYDYMTIKYNPPAVRVRETFYPTGYFNLSQNYPNPFNPSTSISFQLSAVSDVTLKINNVLGQEVATLLNNETLESGQHEVQFDASKLSSGVYFYRIAASNNERNFVEVKKMVLMK